MITIGMNYQTIPGKDDDFIAVFAKVMQTMKDTPGHAETHLFRDVFDQQRYMVTSEWTDEDAFNAFIASDRFKNVVDWGKQNVLAARPTHHVYTAGKPAGPGAGRPAS